MRYYEDDFKKTQYVRKLILTAVGRRGINEAGLDEEGSGRSYSFEEKYKEYIDHKKYSPSVRDIISHRFKDGRPIKIAEGTDDLLDPITRFYFFPLVDFTSVKTMSESLSFLGEDRDCNVIYTLNNVLCAVDADYKIKENSSLSPDKIQSYAIIEKYNFFFDRCGLYFGDAVPTEYAVWLNDDLIPGNKTKNDVLIDLLSKKKQIIY